MPRPKLAGNPRGLTDEQCAWLLFRSRELGTKRGKWATILTEWLEKGWSLRIGDDAHAAGSEQQKNDEQVLKNIEQALKRKEEPDRTKRSKARRLQMQKGKVDRCGWAT